MKNAELAETLVSGHSMSKADARKVVDDLFAAILTAAREGEEISLAGFGKFKVKDSPAREGRNPASGETIQIAGVAQARLRAREGRQGRVERLRR